MKHEIIFSNGTDPRNYRVNCSCGWAYSSTFKQCHKHAYWHEVDSKEEGKRWDDPTRAYYSRVTEYFYNNYEI